MRLLLTIAFGLSFLLGTALYASGQTEPVRLPWPAGQDSLVLEAAGVMLPTVALYRGDQRLPLTAYSVLGTPLVVRLAPDTDPARLRLEYRTFSAPVAGTFFLRDTTEMNQVIRDFSAFEPSWGPPPAPAFASTINKSGSLSRGIAFGNAQNLSVNSNLNLQLSGRVTDQVQILASITDNSIPIQPQGNTQRLQDFDQVYIQLFDDNEKLVAGDFQVIENGDHFLRFNKRAQGLLFDGKYDRNEGENWRIQASAALSKGKFSRTELQGVEGNQGPYRLTGPAGEPFVIVLAGTERVFIDGQLLQRGQDADYVIDYNTAEITFTPRRPITKDRRIIVEFQYSDRNYARSVLQGQAMYTAKRRTGYVRWFAETDSRNQPLQQELSLADRDVLAAAGDDLLAAVVPGIDSVGWSPDAVRYALRDSLGFADVLVFSTNPDSALYQAVFSEVGQGKGDYVEDGFTASGRIFRWIAPVEVAGEFVSQGNYAPLQLLARPEQLQVVTGGGTLQLGKGWSLFGNGALSVYDRNTFSEIGNENNNGQAAHAGARYTRTATDSLPWKWDLEVAGEYVAETFSPVERFRAVEFWRNWNLLGTELEGNQLGGGFKVVGNRINVARLELGLEHLEYGEFNGNKANVGLKWQPEKGVGQYTGSAPQANFNDNSNFARHKTHAYRTVGKMRVGYRDEWEWNERRDAANLLPTSYRFHDWETYFATADTTAAGLQVFYRVRTDRLSDSTQFARANVAEQVGLRLDLVQNPKHQLRVNVSNRELRVVDDELSTSTPESTLLGRLEHRLAPGNGVMRSDLFYETGSGLEQKREFVYIEVPPGQGVYVWNDYNADGIKDLGEFEIAAFAYEANYIRTFVPGTEYIRTYTTAFTYALLLSPERAAGLKGSKMQWLERFSAQGSAKLQRRTSLEEGSDRFNPLLRDVADSNLVSIESALRGTLFFNRNNPRFGFQFSVREVQNKTLLANGFDSRELSVYEGIVRVLVAQQFTLRAFGSYGLDGAAADYITGRNYSIDRWEVKPELTWQPGTQYRVAVELRYADKVNALALGGEEATIESITASFRVGSAEKGSVEGRLSYVNIAYSGTDQNALAFAMLEGLVPGRNGTWSLDVRRNVARNLQLSVRYEGRTSSSAGTVHSGGLQARAFF